MFGFNVEVYPTDANAFPIFGQGTTRYRDYGVDGQYEYLLEPHTVTAQARYVRENIHDPNNFVLGDSTSGNLNTLANLGLLRLSVQIRYKSFLLQYDGQFRQRRLRQQREFLP
ncbi:hypothetical protein B0G77_3976 [Paraburkholderia sp. BL10I2N1]|nr:hypothetical protein B0G77_3976 [Paraburkholderia sp. BL10I2N1]